MLTAYAARVLLCARIDDLVDQVDALERSLENLVNEEAVMTRHVEGQVLINLERAREALENIKELV